jgi:molybdopterin-containing oxidoreductase family membrane subunit
MNGNNLSRLLSYSILTLLSILGIIGAVWRMSEGLIVTSLTAFEPWGIWVVMYSFLVGLSGGCILISSLFTVFRRKEFRDVVGPALLVALISLSGGMLFLWLELGQPFRVWNLYLHPNWNTSMARLAWLYPIFMIAIAAGLYLWMRPGTEKKQTSIQWVGIFAPILALLVNWDLGNVFAENFPQHLWGKEWTSPIYLGLTIISGLGMGLVYLSLNEKYGDKYPSLIGTLFNYLVLAVLLYTIIVLAGMLRSNSLNYILFGEYKYVFWVGQVGFLIFLPIALGWLGKQTRRVTFFGWAGLSTLAGIFVSRMYALIVPSEVPELSGIDTIYHGERLVASGYWPNFLEISVVLGLMALFILAYLILSEILGKRFPAGF